jgi:hypothetical protein
MVAGRFVNAPPAKTFPEIRRDVCKMHSRLCTLCYRRREWLLELFTSSGR